MFLSE